MDKLNTVLLLGILVTTSIPLIDRIAQVPSSQINTVSERSDGQSLNPCLVSWNSGKGIEYANLATANGMKVYKEYAYFRYNRNGNDPEISSSNKEYGSELQVNYMNCINQVTGFKESKKLKATWPD